MERQYAVTDNSNSVIFATVDFDPAAVTDTIPLNRDADTRKIKVVSMTSTFASIIRKVYHYEPISTEFIF